MDIIFELSLAAQDHVEGDVGGDGVRRRAQVGVGPPGEARGAVVVRVLVRSRAEEGLALDLPVDVSLA